MSEVIDHVGIRVSDLSASRSLYEAALTELGCAVLGEGEFEGDAYVLFGRGDEDDFAIHAVGNKPGRDRVTTGAHIAFRAPDIESVNLWHEAAVRSGGTDNGRPGVRPEYSGYYYAAFVLDPDGNSVEAVFHGRSEHRKKGSDPKGSDPCSLLESRCDTSRRGCVLRQRPPGRSGSEPIATKSSWLAKRAGLRRYWAPSGFGGGCIVAPGRGNGRGFG